MVRHTAVALALAATVAGVALAKPAGKPAGKKSASKDDKPSAAHTLHVRAIDLGRRSVLVEISGFHAAPLGNLFTFTDERGRHFIALDAHCDEPFPSGTRACELEIPAGYERHRIVSLVVHLGGLHARTVNASEAEIASAWAAASNNAPPGQKPYDGGVPVDGGDDAGP
jgi:hypothetical protein